MTALLTPEQIAEIKERDGSSPAAESLVELDRFRLLRDREAIAAEVLELLDGARSVYREGSNSDTKWETRKATLIKRLRGEV